MVLLYRGARDEMIGTMFHSKCDNKGETIALIKNEKGNIFGGYASIPWTSDGKYHSAPESFIFTLTNIHNIKPTKFPIKNDKYEVFHYDNCGPCFGHGTDIFIETNNNQSYFAYTYISVIGKENLLLLEI